jgi:hypothetical protein
MFVFALGMLLLSIWAVRTSLVEAPKDDSSEPSTKPLPVADRAPSESSSV